MRHDSDPARGLGGGNRLMQMYDVMRFDINIFPLIRQTPDPPSRAASLNGKTITLDSHACARARARAIVEIIHLVPSITLVPVALLERTREVESFEVDKPGESRSSTNTSHRIASTEFESFYAGQDNRSTADRIKTRLRKDTRMRARYLTRRGAN